MLLDSHAHLCSSSFTEDLDEVILRAEQANVSTIVNIATSPQELISGIALSKKHPWIYNVASTTPHDVEKETTETFEFFEDRAESGDLCAIGETGLDYYYEHSPKETQKTSFKRYIKLAKRLNLPLVIHCREAFSDLYKILDEEFPFGKVLLHCFTGTIEEANEGIKRGYFISFSGIVTFKKSQSLQQTAKELPLDKILIETDCPYLAPEKKRGQRNEPSFIVETAQKMADLRGISFEELSEITFDNASRFFDI